MFLPVLLILFAWSTSASAHAPFEDCFSVMTRRSMDNYQPISELWNVGAFACQEFCIQSSGNNDDSESKCLSFIYDHYQHSCRMFDHDGNRPPAIMHPANGFDYYKRTSFDGACKSPSMATLNRRTVDGGVRPAPLPVVTSPPAPPVTPDSGCCKSGFSCCDQPNPRCCRSVSSSSNSSCCSPKGELPPPPKGELPAPPKGELPPPPTAPVDVADCAVHGYLVIIGQELALPLGVTDPLTAGVMVLADIEQAQCSQHCSANKGPNGETVSCSSMNFFPQSQTCEIHENAADPRGTGHLIQNDEVIYAEKFCLPTDINAAHKCNPDELFVMYPGQRIVEGHELGASTPQETIDNCLAICLVDPDCKSVSFNSNDQLCKMHDINLGDAPEALVDAKDEGWMLVENGCSSGARISIGSTPISDENIPPVPPVLVETANRNTAGSQTLQIAPLRPKFKQVAENTVNEIRRAEANKEEHTWPNKDQIEQPSNWSDWTSCQFEVKGERVRVRTRKCSFGSCPEGDMEVRKCNNQYN